jgi:hypothetical protein
VLAGEFEFADFVNQSASHRIFYQTWILLHLAHASQLQITPSCVVILRSLQSEAPQQPGVCWNAPQGHTIVLASFADPVIALVVSHFGSNSVMILKFSDSSSPLKTTATFPCEQSSAMRCILSSDSSSLFVAIATYVAKELHVWQVGLGDGMAPKLLTTKLPELMARELEQLDSAVDADIIINSIWLQHRAAHDSHPEGIDVYLGSRSGVLHKLFCDAPTRATLWINSLKLSDSPLEFVFVQGDQGHRDELLVVGEGQWLIELKQQKSLKEVQPVIAAFQSFDGACNACTFRSPSTACGLIVSLRPLPKPFPLPGSDVGGAIIMTLPLVNCDAFHECSVTSLSQINIGAACSHVAVLPRLSLIIVGALVHNRASLIFISQGRIIHLRPLIDAGGGSFVSLDAREDEDNFGRFTIVATLAGGQHDAAFNVSRGDFTMFEGSVHANWDSHRDEEQTLQGGMAAVGGAGGAMCILRACMKSKIEEEERYTGGSVRQAGAKFKIWVAFDEPFYERCLRDKQVQGAGILSLYDGSSASSVKCSKQMVITCVSGSLCCFSQDNSKIAVNGCLALLLATSHFAAGLSHGTKRQQP